MKILVASVFAIAMLGTTAANAAIHVGIGIGGGHPHHHRVCTIRHHHRVCYWR